MVKKIQNIIMISNKNIEDLKQNVSVALNKKDLKTVDLVTDSRSQISTPLAQSILDLGQMFLASKSNLHDVMTQMKNVMNSPTFDLFVLAKEYKDNKEKFNEASIINFINSVKKSLAIIGLSKKIKDPSSININDIKKIGSIGANFININSTFEISYLYDGVSANKDYNDLIKILNGK